MTIRLLLALLLLGLSAWTWLHSRDLAERLDRWTR